MNNALIESSLCIPSLDNNLRQGEACVIALSQLAALPGHRGAEIAALRPAGISVTVSIGLASNQQNPGITLAQLLNCADKALYAAKAQGRNILCD